MFAISSVIPMWTAWYIGEWELLGEHGEFWDMIQSVPDAAQKLSAGKFFYLYCNDGIRLALIVGVSLGVGRWLAARLGPPT
jgi:hypothetical protein